MQTSAPPTGGAPDLVGKEIAGRYRITSKLGEGGMGAVYRGEQMSLKRAVAIKLLKPELGTNQLIVRRFDAEAKLVARLNHPNIVHIYEFGHDTDGALFIAMEYVEGRSLREAIQREGPFSSARALAIASQIAASLVEAHAHSIVHRDLKPDNVMLQDRGKQRDVVRVLDFGIAKLRDDSRATQQAMTQAGDMLGTPQYMAPEQIRGEGVDGRVDIYALGCIIYEMVTARLPYEAPTIMAMLSKHLLEEPSPPSQRRPELQIPPAIDSLVLRAMAKDPASRPNTMDEFSEMIEAIRQTLPADPNRSSSLQYGAAALPQPTPPPGGQYAPTPPPPMTPGNMGPFVPAPTPAPPSNSGGPVHPLAPPYMPPPIAPTAPLAPRRARSTSHLPLFLALGALLLGGAGIGAWAITRNKDKKEAVEDKQDDPWKQDKDDDDKDEPQDAPPPPTKPEDDPWAANEGASVQLPAAPKVAAAPRAKIGTAMTPIPAGASIKPPAGFTETGEHLFTGPNNQVIFLGPLEAGTNDPNKLAAMWTAKTGFKKSGTSKMMSAGKVRPAIAFIGVDNKGVAVGQVALLYIEPSYRLGVMYQAPGTLFADATFQNQLVSFFKNNVVMP